MCSVVMGWIELEKGESFEIAQGKDDYYAPDDDSDGEICIRENENM